MAGFFIFRPDHAGHELLFHSIYAANKDCSNNCAPQPS
jgi:hypothetical protein